MEKEGEGFTKDGEEKERMERQGEGIARDGKGKRGWKSRERE